MNAYIIQENENYEQTYIRQFENHAEALKFFNRRYSRSQVNKHVEYATLTFIGGNELITELFDNEKSIHLHSVNTEKYKKTAVEKKVPQPPPPTPSLLHEAEKAQA